MPKSRLAEISYELPAPPPAALDDVLDAVARELGVDRTTIYRRAGNVEEISRLLAARELHRFLADVANLAMTGPAGPEALADTLANLIEKARAHPVVIKLLADERDLVGSVVAGYARPFIRRTSAALAPLLEGAMEAGRLARRDPQVVSEWLVRISASLVLVEPSGDLRPLLADILIPALRPKTIKRAARASKR
jgi:AcrR family transcriptional regulator